MSRKIPIDKGVCICYNEKAMNVRGKFIVFEGADGSGKSTQIKLLSKYLKSKDVPCFLTGEPTDSPFGALIRSCLHGRLETDEHTIAALFAADRLDHIRNRVNGIESKLSQGITVLCDRYYLSSFAYNGGFVDLDWVISLNATAMAELKPDLTIFLDLATEESMARVLRRGETERYETLEKQKRIREKYFELFKRFPEERVALVKSEAEKEVTQAHIREIIDREFGF